MSEASPASTPPPAIAVGRYLMFGVIASGGMASVHYGLLNGPVGFRRTVAIKKLHSQFSSDQEFVEQFLDEARLAARIRHPNVVQTLDVVAENRELLLVMEYIDGETMARLLSACEKNAVLMPIEVAVGILSGALHGLHAAHEATDEQGGALSIVHRDFSPQNILVARDGVPRVLDFGVAKAAARIHSTQGAKVKGKLRYMSPEQVTGDDLDRRTDVFAAGIVLWQALTGKKLFDSAAGPAAIIHQVLHAKIPNPKSLRPEISPELDEIVMRSLRRPLEERFQTAHDMAVALEAAVRIPSAHAIGSWVKSVAATDLDQRARVVQRIESGQSDKSNPRASVSEITGPLLPVADGTGSSQTFIGNEEATRVVLGEGTGRLGAHIADAQTGANESSNSQVTELSAWTTAEKKSGLRRALPPTLMGLGALVVALSVFLLVKRDGDKGVVPPRAPIVASAPGVNEAKSAVAASPPPTPEATPTASAAAEKASAAPLETAKVSVSKPVTAKPATATKPKPAPATKACANPTYVDASGIRRFKKECL